MPINCGALPENLIESELFGHRKGAFTGADEHRVGLFEVANGGTLFLDEIGELPKADAGQAAAVPGKRRDPPRGRQRVVHLRRAAWSAPRNRRLDEMVADGEFREDLWFRINTFEIALPPLRERIDDIPPLARHLAAALRPHAGADDRLFSPEALAALQQHAWPGNVRELANVIEHALILCDEGPIRPRAPAAAFHASRRGRSGPLRPAGRVQACATWRCRPSRRPWTATAATSPRPPRNWASA